MGVHTPCKGAPSSASESTIERQCAVHTMYLALQASLRRADAVLRLRDEIAALPPLLHLVKPCHQS